MLIQVNFDFSGTEAALYTTKPIGLEFFTQLALGSIAVLENGEISLAVETPSGGSYKVQYSDNLSDWMDAATILSGSGLKTVWTDTGPPETNISPSDVDRRFYRLMELPDE
jgi:hypothetical protein